MGAGRGTIGGWGELRAKRLKSFVISLIKLVDTLNTIFV